MAIKVVEGNIRTHVKAYSIGDTITSLSVEDEARLVSLGVAEYADEDEDEDEEDTATAVNPPADPPEDNQPPEDTAKDPAPENAALEAISAEESSTESAPTEETSATPEENISIEFNADEYVDSGNKGNKKARK